MKQLSYILLVVLLTSCVAQKRLNRLLSRHPELAKDITKTIVDTTTVITKDVRIDTIHSLESMRVDTFVLTRENLTIKTFVHRDSIYVFGNCESDTITVVKRIEVPVKQFVYQPKTFLDKVKSWGWVLMMLAVLVLLIKYILGFFKK